MADVGWVALGGALVGVIGKGLWDFQLAAGKVRADREARAEARRDKRAERRDELQRQTLLDLQDAAMTLARATAKGHHHDTIAAGKLWIQQPWPDEVAEESRLAQARLRLLQSRVKSDALRRSIEKFSTACADQNMADTQADAHVARIREDAEFNRVIDTAGKLVREMDDI